MFGHGDCENVFSEFFCLPNAVNVAVCTPLVRITTQKTNPTKVNKFPNIPRIFGFIRFLPSFGELAINGKSTCGVFEHHSSVKRGQHADQDPSCDLNNKNCDQWREIEHSDYQVATKRSQQWLCNLKHESGKPAVVADREH
jgi:hypothetical protein